MKPTKKAIKESLGNLKNWSRQCHAASIHLVHAGFGKRVCRGTCAGVLGQHSWVICSDNCYDESALIIDPTLWSYRKDVRGIYIGKSDKYRHVPHGGSGNIWNWGRPICQGGEIIKLSPSNPLSSHAKSFLDILGPLDAPAWGMLCSAPVKGWPAAEIIQAMAETDALRAVIPIDRIGMLTNQNPGGMYL